MSVVWNLELLNLNAIALGLLQVLALELPDVVWAHFPQWFRTLPNHGFPSEQIVRMVLQHLQPIVFRRNVGPLYFSLNYSLPELGPP